MFIGVNCGHPGATCFCVSMDTGPRCSSGFDIALTELEAGFTAEAGTRAAPSCSTRSEPGRPTEAQVAESHGVTEGAAGAMGRTLETADLPGLLYRNPEHPRWDDVASRCLTCTNCTMACPTCFCHDITDGISLDGAEATREREWASCFSEEYSHMSFGEVRSSRARATASGSPTSSRRGSTSSARAAASGAGAASPGARWAST